MHSDPENRISNLQPHRKSYWGWIALAAVLIVGIYFFADGQSPNSELAPAPPAPVALPTPEPSLPPAPDIPPAPEPESTSVTEEIPVPAPSLENSDEELRVSLSGANASSLLTTALANDNLIERSANIVDGLSRGAVPYKALPIKPPGEKISVVSVDNQIFLDTNSYQRYDSYARAVGELSTETMAVTFNRFRPLLEQAYVGLGYSADEFDNALIRSLDRILATPQLHQAIELKKKEAIYIYADDQLEQLTPIQKLLLRMGPDNMALIQAQANALRKALLQTDTP